MLNESLLQVIKQVDGCGHPLQVKCCEKPDPKMCKSPCKRTLPCGHKCTTLCSVACTQNCLELIPSVVQPACGHLLYISCYMQRKSEYYIFYEEYSVVRGFSFHHIYESQIFQSSSLLFFKEGKVLRLNEITMLSLYLPSFNI
jgi:hypothetical protein